MTNNAINSNIPIEVTKGGTQASSFVAYAPIVGGTTSTGALQSVASAGNAGEFLVSGGPSALPTWAAGGGGGFSGINIQTFSATGLYTPSANTKQVVVYICGGGAGGGNTTNLNQIGSGGGPGETRIGTYSAAQLASAAPITVTIGAGGAGGNNGQASSFGSLITTGFGLTPSPFYAIGGTSTGTGGSFAIMGSNCTKGVQGAGDDTFFSGPGGSSFFAQGGDPQILAITGSPVNGLPGTNGSGGSGSIAGAGGSGGPGTGGSGGNGYCVVYEYIG